MESHGEDEARFFSEVHNVRMRCMDKHCNVRNVEKTLGKRIQNGAAKTPNRSSVIVECLSIEIFTTHLVHPDTDDLYSELWDQAKRHPEFICILSYTMKLFQHWETDIIDFQRTGSIKLCISEWMQFINITEETKLKTLDVRKDPDFGSLSWIFHLDATYTFLIAQIINNQENIVVENFININL